uniref:CUE domain-containing protein n=2 Tax=Clytia hemisphaerica TaxID=252671 RepID=A0A7M5U424_9CNID
MAVIDTLVEEFPALKSQTGAIELWKCTTGGSGLRKLSKIELKTGYSVDNLKSQTKGGIIYIIPLRSEIKVELSSTVGSRKMTSGNTVTVTCEKCQGKVPLADFLQHHSSCSGGVMKQEKADEIDLTDGDPPDDKYVSSGNSKENDMVYLRAILPNTDMYQLEKDLDRLGSAQLVIDEALAKQAFPPIKKIKTDKDMQSTSSAQQAGSSKTLTVAEKLDLLKTMFPQHDEHHIQNLLKENSYDISEACDDIFLSKPIFEKKKFKTLDELILHLEDKLSDNVYRVNVHTQSVYNDLLGFYKSSKFQPDRPLKIILNPAADYGGVLNHCYTLFFEQFRKQCFLQCESGYFLPVYQSSVIVTKLYVKLGTMIAHSISQDGPGFPFFCPSLFYYLVHGSINESIPIGINDIADAKKSYVANKVSNVTNENLEELNEDEDVMEVIGRCGEKGKVTMDNKCRIVQEIIMDEIYGQRKLLYDQIRTGLKINNFADILLHNQGHLNQYFIPNFSETVSMNHFKLENGDEAHKGYFQKFVSTNDQETLRQMLLNVTGKRSLPRTPIQVKFDAEVGDVIHSSTCEEELNLPNVFPNYEQFEIHVKGAIGTGQNPFNAI